MGDAPSTTSRISPRALQARIRTARAVHPTSRNQPQPQGPDHNPRVGGSSPSSGIVSPAIEPFFGLDPILGFRPCVNYASNACVEAVRLRVL